VSNGIDDEVLPPPALLPVLFPVQFKLYTVQLR